MPRRLNIFDELDRRLVACLFDMPNYGLQEASRRLGVARGTVAARLKRLFDTGVITKLGPYVDPRALGYDVESFTVFEMEQSARSELISRLRAVPNVLEAHIVTGPGDILCRLAARDHDELRVVIDTILSLPGVRRATSQIALTQIVPYRVDPILEIVAIGRDH